MLVPKLRFKREDGTDYPRWNNQKLSSVSSRVTRKNKGNITDIPLTIASLYGLVDQREYFKKTIASQNMEGYYLLHNGEFAYNKSYSKGFDFGAIKRLDRYDCGALSTLYICFAVNNKVDSDFMTHYFDSQKWNKEVSIRCAEGARNHGLLNISTDDFFDIDITLPIDLEEQQKIADFLFTVDEVISQSEAEVQNLEQQKKAAMQKIFSQEVRFKREDGSDYPEWEETKLSSILCEYKETCEKDGTYEHISLTKEGVVPKSERYERDFLVTDDSKKYRVTHIDDICYNPANLKFGVICRNKYGNGIFSPIYVTFRVCGGFLPEFIEMIVTRHDFIKYALRFQQGTVYERMAVSPEDLLSIVVSIPCLEEQQKIAGFLSAYDEAISYAKQELEHWKQLKKGLLQQMFV